jgi:hypothetical protein
VFVIPVESPATGNVALVAKTSNGANDIFRWYDGVTQLGVFKNDGNVGIGTSTPDYKLDINSTSTYKTLMLRANALGTRFDTALEFNAINVRTIPYARIGLQVSSASSGDETAGLTFWTINSGILSEKMSITSGGIIAIGTTAPQSWTKLQVDGTAGSQIDANQQFLVNAPTTTVGHGAGIRLSAASGAKEAVGVIGVVNESSGNSGAMTFHTYALGANIPERMRITSGGRVGIQNTAPQGILEVGKVDENNTYGGHFFSTFFIPINTWTTVFYAPNNNWAAITEFTWTSAADYNRSGAAYMRWAYNAGSNTLGVVWTLFNDSQNSTATFRQSGGEIQVLITGGAANYYVQVRIQGSKAS